MKPTLEREFDRWRGPFGAFIRAQTTASGFLLLALLSSLILVNSPYADGLAALQNYPLGLVFGQHTAQWSLLHLVNDGLIAIFFFLVGLEAKRELLAGELQQASRVGLLLSAAVGGMAIPALAYLLVNAGIAGGLVAGWGIPMATDTAIAIGILAALGAKVPRSVVAFLVGVAIIDDIGAILVIAVYYTDQLAWNALFSAGSLLLLLLLLNRAGLRHPIVYAAIGVGLWIAIVQSGIHASIAGVVVAATVPARPRLPPRAMKDEVEAAIAEVAPDVDHHQVLEDTETHRQITDVEKLAQEATTPLRRWEDSLGLPVALLVLPLFAFLNAGVVIDRDAIAGLLTEPVAIGIVAGLVIGKPAGLLLGVRIGEMLGIARRPAELNYRRLLGIGMLAGVGFTMSTFIAHLALTPGDAILETAKLAIVAASAIAAIVGYAVLRSGAGEEKISSR